MEPDLALYEKNTCTLHVEDGQNINTNNEIIININIIIIIIVGEGQRKTMHGKVGG